jgi:predicted glycosyltransferase involved in capsule biosynthesis
MGHKYQIDTTLIAGQINSAVYEQTCGYNDGFVGWGYKQDLYRLKWILDDALKRCPVYSTEEEWLREHDKKKVIKYLSKKESK